ncbi:MAG TPA: hypothetical protein VNK26_00245 [Pyrinomonadaceae bacterium]|jgi:hypothetical protein|nr:hypothetical protein [Pyrinomonadaceae bacterium]
MLIIREQQLEKFIAADDRELLSTVAQAVIRANPQRVSAIRTERLTAMIQLGIETARAAGMKKAVDIGIFVALMFEIGPHFYRHPRVAEVLQDQNYSMTERLTQLPERVSDEVWDEIVHAYEAEFWFPEKRRAAA